MTNLDYCEHCAGNMKPGNAYGFEFSQSKGFHGTQRSITPEKCMKCEECGWSRRQTREEHELYLDHYKRVEPRKAPLPLLAPYLSETERFQLQHRIDNDPKFVSDMNATLAQIIQEEILREVMNAAKGKN